MVVKVGDEYKATYGLEQFTDDLLETDKVKNSKVLTNAVKFGNQLSKSIGESIVDILPTVGDNMKQRTITAEAPEITQAKKFLVSKIGKQAVKVLSNVNIKDINLKPVITSVKEAILDSDVTIDEAVKIIQTIAAIRNVQLNANDIKTFINATSSMIGPDRMLTKLGRKTAYKLINRLLTGGKETVLTEKEYLDALQNSSVRGPFEPKKKGDNMNKTQAKAKKSTSKNRNSKGSNDISWYTHYNSLLSTVSGLQWQYPNGSVTDGRNEITYRDAESLSHYVDASVPVPTVASFPIKLIESDANSTSYISRIYATLRRANSGSINYRIKDVSAYLFNIRLILAMYSSLRRAYGALPKSSHTDLTRPYSTIAAMGYDYNSFSQNAANLRSFLKQWAKRLETFMPYALPIYKRTEWLFDNIYLTSTGQKDQQFIMRLATVQTYYEYIPGAAGQFTNVNVAANYPNSSYTGLPYANAISAFETVCANFVSSNTNSIIAGDMLKAFGAANIHKLADIPEDYIVEPVYNEEVLDQISNAVLPETTPTYSWLMADDSGYNGDNAIVRVTIADTFKITHVNPKRTYLNTDRNDFSAGYVLSASRFVFNYNTNIAINYGTEIVEGIIIVSYDITSTNPYRLTAKLYTGALVYDTFISGDMREVVELNEIIKVFDYLPKVQLSLKAVTATSVVAIDSDGHITGILEKDKEEDISPYIYDWANWTPLSGDELKAIQNTAIMSLYYCPLEYREVKTLRLVSD